jgi:hypothetical protein
VPCPTACHVPAGGYSPTWVQALHQPCTPPSNYPHLPALRMTGTILARQPPALHQPCTPPFNYPHLPALRRQGWSYLSAHNPGIVCNWQTGWGDSSENLLTLVRQWGIIRMLGSTGAISVRHAGLPHNIRSGAGCLISIVYLVSHSRAASNRVLRITRGSQPHILTSDN